MSKLYGLIGEKLSHSLSSEIHSLILERLNMQGLYNLFEIKRENLYSALVGLKALDAKGVNVTIPYKIDVMEYMDELSEEAEKIGAVNTISFSNNILTGYNTDYFGFGESLKKADIDVKNKRVVILGTGGASKAVVQYLLDNNSGDIIHVSRNPEKSLKNTNAMKVITYAELKNLKAFDIIINCTPIGMYPKTYNSPAGKEILAHFSSAVDLIYNPEETIFIKEAAALGLKTINGLYMLVAQAAAAQEIWHETSISKEIVDEIYKKIELRFYGD